MRDYVENTDCELALQGLDAESIDLTLTSPPWDNLFYYGNHNWDWRTFTQVADELFRITKQGGVVAWDIADTIQQGLSSATSIKMASYFLEIGFNLFEELAIQTCPHTMPFNRHGCPHEKVFVFSKGKPKSFTRTKKPNRDAGQTRYWGGRHRKNGKREKGRTITIKKIGLLGTFWNIHNSEKPNDYTAEHPARMSSKLARDLILAYSQVGDVVLDCFMGTGTTCAQALLHSRFYLGYEIHKPYFTMAQRRIKEAWAEYYAKSYSAP